MDTNAQFWSEKPLYIFFVHKSVLITVIALKLILTYFM
jgi:hypothetical protein